MRDLDQLTVNTLRGLAMDAIQKANSGHPGMPLGMADAAYVLWSRFLKYDPSDPGWPDRDRFVLSGGHGSMLLYGILHLTGLLTLDDLKQFRQLGSKTSGHPEHGLTPLVDTTTGPLGQGFANGVGMAIAERFMRERFGPEVCDHWTWGICGDGDIMEGISSEAASLAGHLQLGRIVYLYDDNHITIDGSTSLAFSEDKAARFEAMGWHVQVVDGHDHHQVGEAIDAARRDMRPSLVCCRTIIGRGSPNKEGTSASHGAPLGVEEIRLTKERLGLDPDASFVVPEEVLTSFRAGHPERRRAREAWERRVAASPVGEEFRRWLQGDLSSRLSQVRWPEFKAGTSVATRKASAATLAAMAESVPNLLGGSADLAGSNGTLIPEGGDISAADFRRRNLHFGIREHAMASICNGMALHGGLVPYCATFLVFHDYLRAALRLAAFMEQRVVHVYTHDSIHVGEDGPTHQPVEHLLALRAIPGLRMIRPGDAAETVEAWKLALERTDGPTALALTRQGLPVLDRTALAPATGIRKGGYVLAEASGSPAMAILASGSEVSLALEARERLQQRGIPTRVVNLACWELFDAQPREYRRSVLLPGVPKVSVEAGRTLGWERYVGLDGAMVGIDGYGLSAPAEVAAEALGLTVEAVVERALSLLPVEVTA